MKALFDSFDCLRKEDGESDAERVRADLRSHPDCALVALAESDLWKLGYHVEVAEGLTTARGRLAKYPVRVKLRIGRGRESQTIKLWYDKDGEIAK